MAQGVKDPASTLMWLGVQSLALKLLHASGMAKKEGRKEREKEKGMALTHQERELGLRPLHKAGTRTACLLHERGGLGKGLSLPGKQ